MKNMLKCAAAIAMGIAMILPGVGTEAAAASTAAATAGKSPSCVVMKFSDDTRYKGLESDERFAELVMEKMLDSGRFQLQTQKPIAKDMEEMLYNERSQEFVDAKRAIESGDLSAVFEGQAFKDEMANTLSTADKGQIVAPSVTSRIGKESNAEYLVHGTIVNLGKGSWEDVDFKTGTTIAAEVLKNIPGFGLLGSIGGGLLQNARKVDTGFGVMVDMRIIRAVDGKVVWNQRSQVRVKKTKNLNVALYTKNSASLNETDYVKALDKAAQEVVKSMVKDLDEHKLFL